MTKKLLIFDMDGVIVDSEPLHAMARAVLREERGLKTGPGLPDPVGLSVHAYWQAVVDYNRAGYDAEELGRAQYALVEQLIRQRHTQPNPGLVETLRWAKSRGMRIAVASSSYRVLVADALDALGVGEYFDITVAGDEVTKQKPAPDPYLLVMARAGIAPRDSAAVEDSRLGVRSAVSAGAFCFGYQSDENQDLSQADRIIHRLDEIIRYMEP